MIGQQVDLIFCNKDEAFGWTETDNLEDAAEALKSSARTFAITLGAEGALVFDGNTLTQVSGSSAKAIDTNGAGDMFAQSDIELKTTDMKLKGQLSTPTYDFRNGRILIESKADIKKRLGNSPDRADAYINGLYALQFVEGVTKLLSD